MDREEIYAIIAGLSVILLYFFIFIVLAIPTNALSHFPEPQIPASNTTNSQNFYVIITSSYPGQAQELTLPLNSSGYMMYPVWNFYFFSDEGNTSYRVYLNGGMVFQGSFVFKTERTMNVSTNFANVSIILTGQTNATVFNFYNIPILHTTLGKYFSGQTEEPPVYTVTQYLYFGAKVMVSSLFAALGAFFVINKTVVLKKKLEVYIK